jgi:hypothetical protein
MRRASIAFVWRFDGAHVARCRRGGVALIARFISVPITGVDGVTIKSLLVILSTANY